MSVLWRNPKDVNTLPNNVQDWLLNTGSLTERLQALTSHFEVEVLGQEPLEPDESECALLQNATNHRWQIREVILKGISNEQTCNLKQDWVFARSVLPDELCNSQFENLGNQPLGQRIFNDKNFIRSEFQIGILNHHPLTKLANNPNQPMWARRSKFKINQLELIVAEAFLPDSPFYRS